MVRLDPVVAPVAPFEIACGYLGCRTPRALAMRFRRGIYPKKFLVRLTPNRRGVALAELIAWILSQRDLIPLPADPKPQSGATA